MFTFGNIRTTEKPKQNLEKIDCLLKEHFILGKQYYLFVVDEIIHKSLIDILSKDIEKQGIESYNIVSVISVKNPKDDSTETLCSLESNWRQYLTFDETEAYCIIAFGSVTRVLNRSADVTYYDFFDDKFNEPRYFCGSEFINGPDKWIYPVGPIKSIYPIQMSNDPTNLFTRFFRMILTRIQKDKMDLSNLDMRDYEIKYIETKEETNKCLQQLENSKLLALDTETDGFSHLKNKLGTIQLSNDGVIGYVFEWKNVDKRILKKVLITATRITLANAKFDVKFLYQNGVTGWYPTDDTVLLSHAINSNRPKGLKSGAIFYCGKFVGYDEELDRAKKRLKVENYLQIPRSILVKYAGLDAIVTWRLQQALDKHVKWIDKHIPNEKIKEWTIERWYKEVMIPNANVATDVELGGVYFDPKKFDEAEKIIKDKIAELKAELAKIWNVPISFKFESTKELGILFKKMGWPEIETSKLGEYKTSDPILNEYELLGKPGIKVLKNLRSYNVALKTFINGWREFLYQHEDGSWRIHPNCNCFGAESFRHAMKDPNFQQTPSGSTIAKYIKKLFICPPNITDNEKSDWLLVTGDFAALQFRLALADGGLNKNGVDKISYEIYGEKGHNDAHSATTIGTFCAPIHMQVIEIENENGEKIIFGEDQKIKIRRKGLVDDQEEIIIKGKEFMPYDEFLELI